MSRVTTSRSTPATRRRHCAALLDAAALPPGLVQPRNSWIPERGYFAVGLDGDKNPIDALASNMGHLLWTGIVDDEHAIAVAKHLVGPDLFTGWGVRTLAASMGAYNPMSYHNGSVWPHDSAIAAAGLMRYGFVAEAQKIALGLIDASEAFGGQLPELFCGFDRSEFADPIAYPTACAPQAWASASLHLVLRTLLRLDPIVEAGRVYFSPVLPLGIDGVHLDNVPLAGHRVSVEVNSTRATIGPMPSGVRVEQEPGTGALAPRRGDEPRCRLKTRLGKLPRRGRSLRAIRPCGARRCGARSRGVAQRTPTTIAPRPKEADSIPPHPGAVVAGDVLLGEHRVGRAGEHQSAGDEQHQLVAELPGEHEVVHRGDDGETALVAQLVDELEDEVLVEQVEAARRLVEQQPAAPLARGPTPLAPPRCASPPEISPRRREREVLEGEAARGRRRPRRGHRGSPLARNRR